MTYSAWLGEVDIAYENNGRSTRVKNISPSVLLREFEKGTSPEEFVNLPYTTIQEDLSNNSAAGPDLAQGARTVFADVTGAGRGALSFFEDTSVLNFLNRPQAAFVVRCLSGLGWICFAASVVLLIVSLIVFVRGLELQEPATEEVRQIVETAKVKVQAVSRWAALPFLGAAFSAFVSGLTFWWSSSLLRGFYYMLGRNQTPD